VFEGFVCFVAELIDGSLIELVPLSDC
jgi:hypothetical protein